MNTKLLLVLGIMLYPTTTDYFMPDVVEYIATSAKVSRYENTVSGLTSYIVDITPRISKTRASAVSRMIFDAARRHKVDPFIYTALIRHESAFIPEALNCYKRRSGYMCDYGLPQVNEVWITELNLDHRRMLEDERYALDVGARILARAKKQWGSDPKWYLYYHSNKEQHRKKYEESVGPHIDAAYDNVVVYTRTTRRQS